MPDPKQCCIIGSCCPPDQQITALTEAIVAGGMTVEMAAQAATIVAPLIRKAHKAVLAGAGNSPAEA